MGRVISCHIPKGGNFKTTSVQAIAEILSKEYAKKVCCIDTDSQCSLSIVSGISDSDKRNNLFSLLNRECSIEECIQKSTYYDIIPGSIKLSTVDKTFQEIGKENFLKEHIQHIIRKYDYILIDTAPALSLTNVMAATASDYILVTAESSYLSLSAIDQLYKTIQSVKKYLNNNLEMLGVLVVRYNPRANINEAILSSLEKQAVNMRMKVFDAKIRETVKIKEAQTQTMPLIDWAGNCTAMDDYRSFLKELIPMIQ